MTREEILNMPAGREMDALIAVMLGWCVDDRTATSPTGSSNSRHKGDDNWLPYYSDSMGDAWEVIECLRRQDMNFSFRQDAFENKRSILARVELSQVQADATYKAWFATAETAPLAICRAALLAALDMQDEKV